MSLPPFPAEYRASGLLLHVTSLPSPYGLDANAYRPADVTVERIADLLTHDFADLQPPEVTR